MFWILSPRLFERRWLGGVVRQSFPATALFLPATLGLHRLGAPKKALIGPHRAGHRFAIADTSLAAHFDFQNRLASRIVLDNGDITVLKVSGLIGPKAGVGKEQDIVMHLCRIPFMAGVKRLAGISAGGFIKLLIFGRAEPGPMHDLALRPVGCRQIGQMIEPALTDGRFQNVTQRHNLVVQCATRWRLIGQRPIAARMGIGFEPRCHPVKAVILHFACGHLRYAKLPKEW